MRILHALLAACALSLFAPTAMAADAPPTEVHAKNAFPMKAADFQKKVDERLSKRKANLEARLKQRSTPETKAKEVRARFETKAAEIRKLTAEATKDGIVTKDEAKRVRHAARVGHPHRHRKHAKK